MLTIEFTVSIMLVLIRVHWKNNIYILYKISLEILKLLHLKVYSQVESQQTRSSTNWSIVIYNI